MKRTGRGGHEGGTGVRGGGIDDETVREARTWLRVQVEILAGSLRHEYDGVKVIGEGADEWEDDKEDAEEERGSDV
jgi:hypothetical protein